MLHSFNNVIPFLSALEYLKLHYIFKGLVKFLFETLCLVFLKEETLRNLTASHDLKGTDPKGKDPVLEFKNPKTYLLIHYILSCSPSFILTKKSYIPAIEVCSVCSGIKLSSSLLSYSFLKRQVEI